MVAQQYGPQVRRSDDDAVQRAFADAGPEGEPARRGLSAHRAEGGRGRRHASRVSPPPSRSIRRSTSATSSGDAPRAAGDRGNGRRRRPHDRHPAQAERDATKPATRPADQGDRAIVDFDGTIDGVPFPGGQAKDFTIIVGEGACCPSSSPRSTGMVGGRQPRSSSSRSRTTTTARKSPARRRSSTITVQSVANACFRRSTRNSRGKFGVASGDVEELRDRGGGQSRSGSSSARSKRGFAEQVMEALHRLDAVVCPIAGRNRSAALGERPSRTCRAAA